MRFSICYNAAGCLPDSESYPYEIDEDQLADQLKFELEDREIDGETLPAIVEHAISLRVGEMASYGDGDSTYALHIERI